MIFNFSVNAVLSSAMLAASPTMASAKVDGDELPVTETHGGLKAAIRDARAKKSPLTINDIRNMFVPKKLEATYDSGASIDNDDMMHSLHEMLLREETPVAFESQGMLTKPLQNNAAFEKKENYVGRDSLSNDFDPQEELGILANDSNPSDPTASAFDGSTPWDSFDEEILQEDNYQRGLQVINCNGYYPAIGAFNGGYPSDFDFQTLVERCLRGNCPYFGRIACWDTSRVQDMSQAFKKQYYFNGDLSGWDTSKVTDMQGMFYFAEDFNRDISSWETSKVKNFESMFSVAYDFNQDISSWDTSRATTMIYMFAFAKAFNQGLGSWDTSKVSDFGYMFERTPFNQDISNWDTSKVTAMQFMFYSARSFNQDINSWDTSKVLNFENAFRIANSFNQCLSSWAPQDYCVSTSGMFVESACPYIFPRSQDCPFDPQEGRWCQGPLQGCNDAARCNDNYPVIGEGNGGYGTQYDFENLVERCLGNNCPYSGTISCWDTSRVTDMSYAFFNKQGFNDDITAWDTSSVTNMKSMFSSAGSFNQNLGAWKTSNVSDFESMFVRAFSFNQDISRWDTSKATSMKFMFYYANSFNEDLGPWNTSNVSNFMYMFEDARSFNMDISNWDTSEVTTMKYMFAGAQSFNQDIDSWDTSNVNEMEKMFLNARLFNQDIAFWDVSNVSNFNGMFRYASSFNQCLSSWAPTNNCIYTSEMFQGSGCPYTASLDQTCLSDSADVQWCRGSVQSCNAACRDSNGAFKIKVIKRAKKGKSPKGRRSTCTKVSKESKSKRNKTCKSRLESRTEKVSDVCPRTCDEC